jgi:hypothetical protein
VAVAVLEYLAGQVLVVQVGQLGAFVAQVEVVVEMVEMEMIACGLAMAELMVVVQVEAYLELLLAQVVSVQFV